MPRSPPVKSFNVSDSRSVNYEIAVLISRFIRSFKLSDRSLFIFFSFCCYRLYLETAWSLFAGKLFRCHESVRKWCPSWRGYPILKNMDIGILFNRSTIVCPQSLTRQRPRERSQSRPESRSFPPSTIAYLSRTDPESGQDEDESFFERPPPPPPPLPPPPSSQQPQTQIDQASSGLVKDEEVTAKITDILDTTQEREGVLTSEELVG